MYKRQESIDNLRSIKVTDRVEREQLHQEIFVRSMKLEEIKAECFLQSLKFGLSLRMFFYERRN